MAEAYDECVSRHFETVMKVSGARVFVAVGSFAWRRFLGEGVTPPASPAVGVYGDQERALFFTPTRRRSLDLSRSPNGTQPQTLSVCANW